MTAVGYFKFFCFFFHCTDFRCDIYSVSLTIQNTVQPEQEEEVKRLGWGGRQEDKRKEGVEMGHDTRLMNWSYNNKRLRVCMSWVSLMDCGTDKRWRVGWVIQMKTQYKGWSWAGREGEGGREGGSFNAPLHVLSIHFIQQGCGIPSNGHGCALDHGAGGWSWRHPLGFLPPLFFFLLQPLLRHLAPVHCRGVAVAVSVGREDREGNVLVKWQCLKGRHVEWQTAA